MFQWALRAFFSCSEARAPANELSPVNLAADGLQISNWAAICGFWRHERLEHSAFLQELIRVLRGARAALAEPSRDVYAAAKPFQTNKLLGYPGRRPDAAQRPPIQDTMIPLP